MTTNTNTKDATAVLTNVRNTDGYPKAFNKTSTFGHYETKGRQTNRSPKKKKKKKM
jgi:hypothetical protein